MKPRMESIVIATTLDYCYYDNNRVHHLVDQFQSRFSRVVVLYKKAYIPGAASRMDQMKGFFTFKITSWQKGNVMFLEVDPLFNHATGLGLGLLKLDGPYTIPPSLGKRIFRRVLSLLGVVTESAVLPCFLLAYWFRAKTSMDVFVGQGPWETTVGVILKRWGRIRTVVYDDFDYAPGNQPISLLRRWIIAALDQYALKKADLIVSVGSLLGGLREQQTGRKVAVIPNGVNLSLFSQAQQKMPHPPTLVYMGFVYGWAGLELILESLEEIKKSIPDIRFLILGHSIPAYIDSLLALRDGLGLGDRVVYMGKKKSSDLIPILKQSDLGMAVFRPIPLRRYAFSLKVVEYMAAGLPVVTTLDTESALTVQGHQSGMAVKFDKRSLADAVCTLLSDPGVYQKYSENARNGSLQYDWKTLIYHRYYDAIQDVCEKNHPLRPGPPLG